MILLGEALREAALSARSQRVTSTLTTLIVAAMVLTVLVTTGRTVAAEQQVIGSIDAAGTRSIVLSAAPGAGLTSSVLDRLERVDGIEWMAAFSSAEDAINTVIGDGTRVGARYIYGRDFAPLGIAADPIPSPVAYGSAEALRQLGMADNIGTLTLTSGRVFSVRGGAKTPDFLQFMSPLLVIPMPNHTGQEEVASLVVLAESPELVTTLTAVIQSSSGVTDPSKVTIRTSQAFAALRSLVQGQLGDFSRGLVLAILVISASLVSVVLYGLVMLRRKDFGRRRALGATRPAIVTLLLLQTAGLAVMGTLLGVGAGLVILWTTDSSAPNLLFVCAVCVLAVAAATVAALTPAVIASRREPIKELRVP